MSGLLTQRLPLKETSLTSNQSSAARRGSEGQRGIRDSTRNVTPQPSGFSFEA